MSEKNIHAGHRQRMKAAMLAHGIDSLNDHQVLELLLFYGIPNGDTNPLAHALIERFGSLRGVLEADVSQLLEVSGVGENTASLIKFSQFLSQRYFCSACFADEKKQQFDDTDSLCKYFAARFDGVKSEQVRAMAVDDDLDLISEDVILEGSLEKVDICIRKIVDFAVRNNCSRLVIAHNHPNGAAMPSLSDLSATTEIARVLKKLDIKLLDHIITGRTGSVSLRATHSGMPVWNYEKLL